MDYVRLIKKEFKFLKKMSFGIKNNTFGPDVYISYLNFYKDICINISVYSGVKCSIEDTKPKEFVAVMCERMPAYSSSVNASYSCEALSLMLY